MCCLTRRVAIKRDKIDGVFFSLLITCSQNYKDLARCTSSLNVHYTFYIWNYLSLTLRYASSGILSYFLFSVLIVMLIVYWSICSLTNFVLQHAKDYFWVYHILPTKRMKYGLPSNWDFESTNSLCVTLGTCGNIQKRTKKHKKIESLKDHIRILGGKEKV